MFCVYTNGVDILIDILVDLLFDGAAETAFSSRAPRWLRILCGLLLLAAGTGICGGVLYLAFKERNVLLGITGLVLMLILVGSFVSAAMKHRS